MRLTKLTPCCGKGMILGTLTMTAVMAAPVAAADLRLMFQGDPCEIDAISDVASRFEEANPGTTVELIHTRMIPRTKGRGCGLVGFVAGHSGNGRAVSVELRLAGLSAADRRAD